MAVLVLQIWGGLCYLTNKILFSRIERSNNQERERILRIWSWIIYLAGVPAWIIIFISEGNWIVAAVEFGATPAMLVGLLIAINKKGKKPKFLDNLAKIFVALGLFLSIYEAGGFNRLSQFLEVGIASGFLMGTYLLAKNRSLGYFWIILGNICAAWLMGMQGYHILMVQQLVSLYFMSDAYVVRTRRKSSLAT